MVEGPIVEGALAERLTNEKKVLEGLVAQDTQLRPYVVDLSFIVIFLCRNLNAACADYLIIFQDLLIIFFATFFKSRLQKIT